MKESFISTQISLMLSKWKRPNFLEYLIYAAFIWNTKITKQELSQYLFARSPMPLLDQLANQLPRVTIIQTYSAFCESIVPRLPANMFSYIRVIEYTIFPGRFIDWMHKMSHSTCFVLSECISNYMYPGHYIGLRTESRETWYPNVINYHIWKSLLKLIYWLIDSQNNLSAINIKETFQ